MKVMHSRDLASIGATELIFDTLAFNIISSYFVGKNRLEIYSLPTDFGFTTRRIRLQSVRKATKIDKTAKIVCLS